MATSAPSPQRASGTFELLSGSPQETHAFGERLGRALRAGDVVAFCGELGSGKTTLIQGVAQGLGLDPDRIKSPTFVLMREYASSAARPGDDERRAGGAGGAIPLIHLDGYRLEGAPSAAWLDLELLFSPHKVTVIEWAERFGGLLPENHLEIRLEHVSTNRRRLRAMAHGARAALMLTQLQQTADSAGQ